MDIVNIPIKTENQGLNMTHKEPKPNFATLEIDGLDYNVQFIYHPATIGSFDEPPEEAWYEILAVNRIKNLDTVQKEHSFDNEQIKKLLEYEQSKEIIEDAVFELYFAFAKWNRK